MTVTVQNANEYQYRKTVTAIGVTMLVFLVLLNLFGLLISFVQMLLMLLGLSEVAAEVIYQLFYAAGYLASFMLPVLVLRGQLQKNHILFRPVKSQLSLSRWLPLILLGGITLIWAQSYINASLVSIFHYSEFTAEMLWSDTAGMKAYQIVLQFIVMCLVPAICEEFLFRGAILTNCLPFGRGNAILISSLLFGLMHQNAEQILYAFAAGIFLGVVYERTGSIWNCVFLHLVNNFSSLIFPILAEKLGGTVPELAYAGLELLLCTVGICCIIPLVFLFSPKKPDLQRGFFGRSLPMADSYAACPVPAGRAFKLFFSFPMVAFLVACCLQILALLGLALLYHAVGGI